MGLFLDTCLGKDLGNKSKIPIWMMRQAGRYLPEYLKEREKITDFIEFCLTPDVVTKVTLQPMDRFDFDAAIIFSDILIIPHSLGQKVWFEAGHGPRLSNIPGVFIPNWEENMAKVYQGIKQTREALPSNKSLIGFAGSPWTLAAYMVCQNKIESKENLYKALKNHNIDELIKKLIPTVATHLVNQVKAGCDVVQLFDSWAMLCEPKDIKSQILDPLKQILELFWSQCPGVPFVYYGREISHLYDDLIAIQGPLILGFDQSAPLVRLTACERVTQGNLDPDVLIAGGDPLKRSVEDILRATEGKSHIFNLGHGIKPETPIKHVEEMIECVRGG